jgi:prolyl-tRNA editing enzyme YbaK/EbsC (Cys-tRNA(Pro) deacylase)
MSLETARRHLKHYNRDGDIITFDVSSATVELAARALGVEEARIAKTISLRGPDFPVLVVAAGDVRIDNQKFKRCFGFKARMLSPQEVSDLVGHEIGGVCPFGVNAGVQVYLDHSLERFDTVYPACGSANSAIRLGCQELERLSGSLRWVDVCAGRETRT